MLLTPALQIRKMVAARKMQLHSVYKYKYQMTGCPLGDFEAYMETPHSLPLVIRGQAGHFNCLGNWVHQKETASV